MKASTKKALQAAGYKVFGNYVMVANELYPLPLVQGNAKLGTTVWHSSTLPTNKTISAFDKAGNLVTCEGTCECACEGCYGTTGNYLFNSSKYAIIMRTKLLKEHPADYFHLVAIQLDYENIERLRIHAVGDFIKNEAQGFRDVLASRPHIKAWTYTKCQYSDEIKALDSLPNCNVVKSVIKGIGFNFGHVAYIAMAYYYLKRNNKSVYICRCGIDKNQHCSDCAGCSSHEYVLFLEHSTSYNAESDYGYEKLKALIESQREAK